MLHWIRCDGVINSSLEAAIHSLGHTLQLCDISSICYSGGGQNLVESATVGRSAKATSLVYWDPLGFLSGEAKMTVANTVAVD